MSLAKLSTCVSVEEFFTQANWCGIESRSLNQETESSTEQELQIASLTLSLEQFFALSNWHGDRQLETTSISELTELTGGQLFTLTVEEFFQRMVWEGRPHIAIVPQPISPEIKPSPNKQLNVTDLSSLF